MDFFVFHTHMLCFLLLVLVISDGRNINYNMIYSGGKRALPGTLSGNGRHVF